MKKKCYQMAGENIFIYEFVLLDTHKETVANNTNSRTLTGRQLSN